MSIEVQNLTKNYGSQKALDKVSFSIGASEIVGFLGPNGAGKSTTMKILSGYVNETSGSAHILGMDVSQDGLKIKKRIGYLPELNPLYGDMYVKEYLGFIADIHEVKDSKTAVNKVIDSTGLGRECHKKINQLSKGYKQRVGLAQALINDPDVLILDEPTSGLDPNQMKEIRSLILSLGEDKTILLSSHIMQEIEAMCSRVIIINKGKIIADDTLDAVKKNWGNKQSSIYVRFRDAIDQSELFSISGIKTIDSLDEKTFIIYSETHVDLAELLFKFAVSSDTIIVEQKEQEISLESIFQKLTDHD
tara:strand:+ start:4856 stop:5770 length:915 start_codon:yes stop_codon:yes gene_type:complete